MEDHHGSVAVHESPAWGHKANFIVCADLIRHGMPNRSEQLWARTVSGGIVEVCCIPFFTYGIALGDHVEIDDHNLVGDKVSKKGHRTLRIAIAEMSRHEQIHVTIHDWVARQRLLYEFFMTDYLAVDIPPSTPIPDISALGELITSGAIAIESDE